MQSRRRSTRARNIALLVVAVVVAGAALTAMLTLHQSGVAAEPEPNSGQSAKNNSAQTDILDYPEVATPVPTSISNLVASHPRIIVSNQGWEEINAAVERDPEARAQFSELKDYADWTLEQPVIKALDAGDTLGSGRKIIDRIVTLAGLYRLTHKKEYAIRAIAEMLSVTSFSAWNSGQFLTVAELTAGVGIGYDWLFDQLTPDQQKQIRSGIERLGFAPFLYYLHGGYATWHSNWGFVVNGGETVGALAIAEHSDQKVSQEVAEILSYTRPQMERLMVDYGPDGALPEGATYWNYAALFNTLYLAALQSSLGTDFDQGKIPGFSKTGDYQVAVVGPIGLQANFGDAVPPVVPSQEMFWLAKRFHNPAYTQSEMKILQRWRSDVNQTRGDPYDANRFGVLGLFWYVDAPKNPPPQLPLLENFRGIDQSFLRSSWDDNAWFVAFKGGHPNVGHRHLDLGSFVFDAEGQRFGLDLGMESYSVPGYFDSRRWDVYRARSESHNLVTVGNDNEALSANESIVSSEDKNSYRFSIMDLKNAYPDSLTGWKRGVKVTNDSTFTVQDEITPRESTSLIWHFMTKARVTLLQGGHAVRLDLGTSSIMATLPESFPSKFEIETLPPVAPPQTPNPGVTDVVIHLQVDGPVTIPVVFTRVGVQKPVSATPLGSW